MLGKRGKHDDTRSILLFETATIGGGLKPSVQNTHRLIGGGLQPSAELAHHWHRKAGYQSVGQEHGQPGAGDGAKEILGGGGIDGGGGSGGGGVGGGGGVWW